MRRSSTSSTSRLRGVAEAELERDVHATMRRLAYSGSGNAPGRDSVAMVSRGGGFLDHTTDPDSLPPWLTVADIEFYASEFGRTGFRGGLNWYRNIDRNWELLAPFAGAVVTVPALYVAGDRDLVVRFPGMDQLISNLSTFVPQLRRTVMLPGSGHWTQQERAREVNDGMLNSSRESDFGYSHAVAQTASCRCNISLDSFTRSDETMSHVSREYRPWTT